MRTVKITGLAAVIFIFIQTACKKNSNNTNNTTTPPDECSITRGLNDGDTVPGRYIIAYNPDDMSRTASRSTLSRASEDVLQRNSIASNALQDVFGGEPGGFIANLNANEAARLRTDPMIQAVEHDRVVALSTCFTIVEPRLITWNINRVGYGDGRGKTAWIIDTGIDMTHPDLTVDATRSRSFISGQTSPNDANGHGTHVAGIIGANNNSIGVLGVASGATLISLRVLDADGKGLESSIIQALAYVNANASAGDVVNMSLGDDSTSFILDQQVQNTASRGIYIAIAAGNDHQPANKFSPADAVGPNIFTVSAIDSLDRFASFSNYGNDVVDYAAPGVRIVSTYSEGRYAILSGTSMAAPHVAGLLLLRGRNLNTSGTALNDPDGHPDPIAHY
jgi:subtilisin family serine protease